MDLDRDFPAWSLWRSKRDDGSPGSWWASRRRLLTESEMKAGLLHTLAADDREQLLEQLNAQAELEEVSPTAEAAATRVAKALTTERQAINEPLASAAVATGLADLDRRSERS